jgi:hypothetical protein
MGAQNAMNQGRNWTSSNRGSEAKGAFNFNKKSKPTNEKKTERLRELRLADEAARRAAGTWGDVAVGEIFHAESGTVYVQVWKGERRPNPLGAVSPNAAGVPAADWPLIVAWVEARGSSGFSQRIVASHLSTVEARRVKVSRLQENHDAGMTVINLVGRPEAPSETGAAP